MFWNMKYVSSICVIIYIGTVFQYLDLKDLCNCNLVCRLWNAIPKLSFFQHLYVLRFGIPVQKEEVKMIGEWSDKERNSPVNWISGMFLSRKILCTTFAVAADIFAAIYISKWETLSSKNNTIINKSIIQ